MYSDEELMKFYFNYLTEWMLRGMSIQTYCLRNNVPYKLLDRWNRYIYKRVVLVKSTRTPEQLIVENPQHTEIEQKTKPINDNISIISTLKLYGKGLWNFLVDLLRCEILGSESHKYYLLALNR